LAGQLAFDAEVFGWASDPPPLQRVITA